MVPVLLLHGSGPGTTGAAWKPLVEALDERFEVFSPDLPGFGNAPAAPIEEWADRLAPDNPCVIIGNSAGGAIALKLAARGLATKVVAVGSMGFPMPLPPALEQLWATGPTDAEARSLLRLIFHDPPGEDAVAARLEAMRAQPHYLDLFPAPRQRWVDALSLTPGELAGIDVPVLLIHGANDQIVPPTSSLVPLLHTLPDVRAHLFGRCGHASPQEHTAEFNRLVLSFLEP